MRAALPLLICAAVLSAQPRYFPLLNRAIAQFDGAAVAREAVPKSHHYPGALLVAAVLYAKAHPDNPRAGDAATLALACKLGDVLAEECEAGVYTRRGDHHRDTYMWLEAYRLLKPRLGEIREARWRRELVKLIAGLADEAAVRKDRAAYTSPFGVSVNHMALFSSTVYLAGHVFDNRQWRDLGAAILHRYAAEEQSPDGYWGEHSLNGPTTAYDYLTATGVALYWEHSRDPAALKALRRSTDFHRYFTYPDGLPVMSVDDRRRHSYVSAWGHFGFSNFPDGRRYAGFLTGFFDPAPTSFEHLGRLAQNALYYREGPLAPIPQDAESYVHRLGVPAAIRKTGPWVVSLSGIIATQNAASRFYLDRQCSLEIFHKQYGVIVSGANSKRQPELATFRERVRGQIYHMPLDSRLRMSDARDRLSLAYNTFTADLEVDPPAPGALPFRFAFLRKGSMQEAWLTLQLCLKPGEAVETGGGKLFLAGAERVITEPGETGGSISHRGWSLSWTGPARFEWPIYPYNPYADAPETSLEYAVAALSLPLGEPRIEFRLVVK